MQRYEVYGLALALLVSNVALAVSLKQQPEIISARVNIVDELYQVDGVRLAIVRENRDMGQACMWCDQTQNGEGYEVIRSDKKGFIIDLRERKK